MSKISEEWVEDEHDENGGHWRFPASDHYVHQRKPFDEHYPDKKEAKLLRKIMSETGLTEKEVRGIKKYRVMLSETQKQVENNVRGVPVRDIKHFLKDITKDLKLPKEHPFVEIEFNRRRETYSTWWGGHTVKSRQITWEEAIKL